jgi:predicted enzyme related to lactoylglutathione lyase
MNPSSDNGRLKDDTTPRVTGIGGIFFYAEKPSATQDWYAEHLGMAMDAYGSVFEFRNANRPEEINYMRWSIMAKNSNYMSPSPQSFMINYRVNNLEGLIKKLRQANVSILDTMETYDYGKFIHIMDPEGNKIELWEPVDSVLTKMGSVTTK